MIRTSGRERIFEAAIKLFCTNGFSRTTIGQIEGAAGLTPRAGGFYRHFGSKDELLREAVERMSAEMLGELRLEDIVVLRDPRAELLVIARAMLRHAEKHRPFRLLIQREAHLLPVLRRAAKQANARLAALDVVPWVADMLRRAHIHGHDPRQLALIIFGPIVLYLLSVDRGDPAFQLRDERFLEPWAQHWADWFAALRGTVDRLPKSAH